MTKHSQRIPPLPMSEWGEAEKDALSVFIRPGSQSLQQGGDKKPKDMSALSLLLQHPALAKAMFPLTRHLLYDNVLPARDRELLVLRVSWHRQAEYEWGQHVIIARVLGMPDEEIARVTKAEIGPEWSDKDQLLLKSVDELIATASMSDACWGGLTNYYNKHEMMEIVTAVGAYDLMAMVFNSYGLPNTDDINAVLKELPVDCQ